MEFTSGISRGFMSTAISDPVVLLYRWQETLVVYPRTNKQNQKKKRKVEPPTPQVQPKGPIPAVGFQAHCLLLLRDVSF